LIKEFHVYFEPYWLFHEYAIHMILVHSHYFCLLIYLFYEHIFKLYKCVTVFVYLAMIPCIQDSQAHSSPQRPQEALQERGNDIRPDGFWQTHQKEKITFLHFDVLRKRIKLRGEMQLSSTLDRSAPSLPSLYALYGESVRFFIPILTP